MILSKFSQRIFAGVLLASLMGCGIVADPSKKVTTNRVGLENICPAVSLEVPQLSAGVIGGELATPTSWIARETVFIIQASGTAQARCTGSLVGPNLVLTAAHCVAGTGRGATFVVFKSRPLQGQLNPADPNQVAVVDVIRVHPHYQDSAGSEIGTCSVADAKGRGDIALLHLATPAPKTAAIAQLMPEKFSWTELESVTVAGYGDTVGGENRDTAQVALRTATLAPLRRMEIDMVRIRAPFPTSTLAHMFDTSENAENIWLNQTGGRGVCNGDSGGPSFVVKDGRHYQIGVLSAVTGQGKNRCNGFGLTTNVQFYREWLEQTFVELGGAKSGRRLFR